MFINTMNLCSTGGSAICSSRMLGKAEYVKVCGYLILLCYSISLCSLSYLFVCLMFFILLIRLPNVIYPTYSFALCSLSSLFVFLMFFILLIRFPYVHYPTYSFALCSLSYLFVLLMFFILLIIFYYVLYPTYSIYLCILYFNLINSEFSALCTLYNVQCTYALMEM